MIQYNYNVSTRLRKHSSMSTVSFVIRWNKKKHELWYATGYQWSPEKWDKEKQRARNNTTIKDSKGRTVYARDVNSMILSYLELIEKAFNEFKTNDLIPTPKDLRDRLHELIGLTDKMPATERDKFIDTHETFKAIHDQYMHEMAIERSWSKSHKDKTAQVWKCLCACEPKITLRKLNRTVMNELLNWYFEKGYHNSTTEKRFRDLKTFLRWVKQNDYPVNDDALNYKPSIPKYKKVVTYFTFDELQTFASYEFEQSHLINVRDIFCFMCYSSLRYSDVKGLKKDHLYNDGINFYTQKTKDLLQFPLNQYAQAILNKYMKTDGEYVFKVPSNQKFNAYIKKASKEAGLDRKIHKMYYVGNERHESFIPLCEEVESSMGRRTFITTSIALGIPAEIVMKCSGHSSFNAMKPYLAVASSTVKKELEKWNKNSIKLTVQKKVDRLSPEQLEQLNKYLDELMQKDSNH